MASHKNAHGMPAKKFLAMPGACHGHFYGMPWAALPEICHKVHIALAAPKMFHWNFIFLFFKTIQFFSNIYETNRRSLIQKITRAQFTEV